MRDEIRRVAHHPKMMQVTSLDQGLHNVVVYTRTWSCPDCVRLVANGE
jgi:hypothetical protein